jgi:hypothetical protein
MRKACGKRESVAAAQVKLVKLVNKVFHDSLQNREASRSTTCQEHPRSKIEEACPEPCLDFKR